MQKTADYLKKNFQTYLEDLKKLVRIPSVSFSDFPPAELARSAEAVAGLMKERGLENVRVIHQGDGHPYAYGERLKAPGKPTLLLYAHHDVQPPGREEVWKTPPFEPTEAEGPGGRRLYGRGTADDKAGVVVHLAAIDSYLKTVGELPVNVKMVVEGEEEIGSSHLVDFLAANKKMLASDIMVLTDTGNFDCGIPALTVALRGLVEMHVEVWALSKSVHSGMWGGPLPDPAMALSKMLATLVDAQGRIAIPGMLEQVRPIDAAEEKELAAIPYDEKDFRAQSGMLPGVQLLPAQLKTRSGAEPSPAVQLWRLPSLTVNAIQASSRKQAGNIINDSAWAKVTVRLVPDMDPQKVARQLEDHLRKHLPWGLKLELQCDNATSAWSTSARGPAFEAAERALERGYGKAPLKVGSGGSIPFVKPFAEALGGAPAILIGVEDPFTNAHGENESLLISDLEKSCVSQVYLFRELADSFRK